jgi:hypothetical protein
VHARPIGFLWVAFVFLGVLYFVGYADLLDLLFWLRDQIYGQIALYLRMIMVGKSGVIIGPVQVYHAQEIRTPADELARQAIFVCQDHQQELAYTPQKQSSCLIEGLM